MNTILAVGTVAFDKIESPFGKTEKILGGAATYISLAASNFEANINILSTIGYDFPHEYLDILNHRGINTAGIDKKKDEKTFYWGGKYSKDLNNRKTLFTELNALEKFDPVLPDEYKNPDILMLGNLTPNVQKKVIQQLNKKPYLTIMDTMNFWIENTPNELSETIKLVDILTINDEEARMLSGEYFIPAAAKKIIEMGPKFLIIKKGEHGAFFFTKDDIFFCPAVPLDKVKDPTGAGDSFAGGFCGYIAQSNDFSVDNLKNAIVVATAVASFTVQDFGTQNLLNITKDELINRINFLKKMTNFDMNKIRI